MWNPFRRKWSWALPEPRQFTPLPCRVCAADRMFLRAERGIFRCPICGSAAGAGSGLRMDGDLVTEKPKRRDIVQSDELAVLQVTYDSVYQRWSSTYLGEATCR